MIVAMGCQYAQCIDSIHKGKQEPHLRPFGIPILAAQKYKHRLHNTIAMLRRNSVSWMNKSHQPLPIKTYKLNLVRTFSSPAFHFHSCPLVNCTPRSTLRNLSVNLGPISCKPALIPSTPSINFPSAPWILFSVALLSLNTYLCLRKKM